MHTGRKAMKATKRSTGMYFNCQLFSDFVLSSAAKFIENTSTLTVLKVRLDDYKKKCFEQILKKTIKFYVKLQLQSNLTVPFR